jgi:hypothetical protein
MKITRLKEIIREEVKKALKEKNDTEVAPVKPDTKEKEKPGTEKPKTPYVNPNTVPKRNPKAKNESITAKDFVNKYNKLKGK